MIYYIKKEKKRRRKKKNLLIIIYREIFDRKSDSGFTQHTKIEHYMWNYIFYIGYLKDKDPNEDYNFIDQKFT